PAAKMTVEPRPGRSQQLRRSSQKYADCRGDDVPGREDQNGHGDSIAVERDERCSESPRGSTCLRIAALPNEIHVGISHQLPALSVFASKRRQPRSKPQYLL